jgi:hypothetical protein
MHKSAYIWDSDESVSFRSSDKLCMFVQNGYSNNDAKIELIEFDYNFRSIDLQPDLFINSVIQSITRVSTSIKGDVSAMFELFQRIKCTGFSECGRLESCIKEICSSPRVVYKDPSFKQVADHSAFAEVPSTVEPVLDVILQDLYADMNVFSHAKERFDKLFDAIAIEVFGDYLNECTYYNQEDRLRKILKRKFFPLTPLNIAAFKMELILQLYPIKASIVADIAKDSDSLNMFEDEADILDRKIFKKLLDAGDKCDKIRSDVDSVISLIAAANEAGCSDIKVGTF